MDLHVSSGTKTASVVACGLVGLACVAAGAVAESRRRKQELASLRSLTQQQVQHPAEYTTSSAGITEVRTYTSRVAYRDAVGAWTQRYPRPFREDEETCVAGCWWDRRFACALKSASRYEYVGTSVCTAAVYITTRLIFVRSVRVQNMNTCPRQDQPRYLIYAAQIGTPFELAGADDATTDRRPSPLSVNISLRNGMSLEEPHPHQRPLHDSSRCLLGRPLRRTKSLELELRRLPNWAYRWRPRGGSGPRSEEGAPRPRGASGQKSR